MVPKQLWLGVALMVGGAVMMIALTSKSENWSDTQNPTLDVLDTTVARPSVQPLTADVKTEERILTQKQKEREARVQALEQETKELLRVQAQARTEALNKAQQEAKAYASPLVVEVRPESLALAEQKKQEEQAKAKKIAQQQENERKAKELERKKAAENKEAEDKTPSQIQQKGTRHTVQSGDNLLRLSRQYNIPVSVLAAANNMGRNDVLQRGRTIKIPAQSEIDALKRKADEQQKKQAEQKDASQRLAEARKKAKKQGSNETYKVQVALAANQNSADALAKELRLAGYKVTTEPARRGVRVTIGPERSKEAALALRDKINADPSVSTHNAWVLQ